MSIGVIGPKLVATIGKKFKKDSQMKLEAKAILLLPSVKPMNSLQPAKQLNFYNLLFYQTLQRIKTWSSGMKLWMSSHREKLSQVKTVHGILMSKLLLRHSGQSTLSWDGGVQVLKKKALVMMTKDFQKSVKTRVQSIP